MEPIATLLRRLRRDDLTTILLAASILFAFRLTVALALIPPWQQPDEPTHVAVIERFSARAVAPTDAKAQPGREDEILESMTRHRWWEHRAPDFRTPAAIPDTFGFRVGVPSQTYVSAPAYALLYGWAVGRLPPSSVVDDLYLLRAAAAGLGLLTLWVAWLAARECVGVTGGAVVALLLALHPQFAISSTAAGSDPIANFFGACVWWGATLAVTRTCIHLPLAGMWTSAFAAASLDRMGLPLLVVASVVSLLVVVPRVLHRTQRRIRVMVTAGVFGIVVLAFTGWGLVPGFGGTYGLGRVFAGGITPVPGAITWDGFIRFSWLLHHSWWYSIGWGRYTPPLWWFAIVSLLTAAATVGLGRRFLRDATLAPQTRMLIVSAAAGVSIQLAAVYWTYFRLGNGAQGRYLFPVLVPSLVLLWTGIEAWAPPERRAYVAAALVLLFGVLDATAWGLVAIPAYYASF